MDLRGTARTAIQSESLRSDEGEQEFYAQPFPSNLGFCDLWLTEHLALSGSVQILLTFCLWRTATGKPVPKMVH